MPDIDYKDMVGKLRSILEADREPHHIFHSALLNTCAMQGYVLVQHYIEKHGAVVYSGPFKGMKLGNVMPNFLLSRYIGSYEHDLADIVLAAARTPYDTVLNIGCAEGYYAVGLARLMPKVRVHAFDILDSAREKCRHLAEMNAVSDRLTLGERFEPSRFADYTGRTLVVCDIEGGEFDLLDPAAASALAGMDLIVEMHERGDGRATAAFRQRFHDTHETTLIESAGAYRGELPAWLQKLGDLDIHLASSSFRPYPTPWLHLKSRAWKPVAAA